MWPTSVPRGGAASMPLDRRAKMKVTVELSGLDWPALRGAMVTSRSALTLVERAQ